MLLCSLEEVEPGMTIAAPVLHPKRPEVELLSPGVKIERRALKRLGSLGVAQLWVEHDATADLDELIDPNMGRSQVAVYESLKSDFAKLSCETVSVGQVQIYRQTINALVCELMANKAAAGLSELLRGEDGEIFAHSSAVAYLSVLTGLTLESYLIRQRRAMSPQNARDVVGLGIGAMLHDIGKLHSPVDLHRLHEVNLSAGNAEKSSDESKSAYFSHPEWGYRMLRQSGAPASATQVVLTHHQRFDGTGFPDMAKITEGRQLGPQSGERIHIFSRIVAAANALDNLVRQEVARKRPVVCGLAALADERFDGWFDPVVRDAMLRRIPPFSIGSRVTLSDGEPAAVVGPNVRQPCRPMLRLLAESARRPDGSYPVIDLQQEEHQALHIAACQGVDVQGALFTLPDDDPLAVRILYQASEAG